MSNTSKTAKIIKRWHRSLSHCLNVNVLWLWFLLFLMCCSLHVAFNLCINCSFVDLYLLFYYSLCHFSWFGPYYFSSFQVVFVGYIICFLAIYVSWAFAQCLYHFRCIILLCCICRTRMFWRSECIYRRFGHFWACYLAIFLCVMRMCRNSALRTFGSKSFCHRRSQQHWFPINILKHWRFHDVFSWFSAAFYWACKETISELLATILSTTEFSNSDFLEESNSSTIRMHL